MNSNKDKYLIITGRFQPLHQGHLELFKKVISEFGLNLIVCVLRNQNPKTESIDVNEKTKFEIMSIDAQSKSNNPLPNWERLELINIAIRNDVLLKDKVTVLFRDRPNINWENSIHDLPENRIWVFNTSNSEFEKSKADFYRDKGEEIFTVDYPSWVNSTQIREKLRTGNNTLDFLPQCCRNFFAKNCIHYINQNPT